MTALKSLGRACTALLFALTDPIVIPARKIGMLDPKRIGATAIEYGLIAAGVSIAIIAVVNGLGCKLNNTCNKPPAAVQQVR